MKLNRRSFLKSSLAIPAAATLPSLFARALYAGEERSRVLVLVQLDGGNDGLNTLVPYGDDLYHKARPSLAFKDNAVVKLDEYHGLHPSLGKWREIWDAGNLGVIQGVGYPNPSLSHFTSTDVWHTAASEPQARWSGWLGRALDRAPKREIPALHLDPGPLSLALIGERVVVPSVADAERFAVRGAKELLELAVERPRADTEAEFVRRSADQAYRTATRIETALKGGKGRERYPQSELSQRLWQVARMIQSNLGAHVYAVRLSGFDTHSRQGNIHSELMRLLGDGLAAFQQDLNANGLADRVMTVTYSEFGRRVYENRSLGTDHGKAAPMFVMGGSIKGGLHGKHPKLDKLSDGSLQHHTDFRQVYATLLDRWIGADSKAVLGQKYSPLAFV